MTERVIYPRFLGIDGSGDFVWELATGRWTWGDDPHAAVTRERTFEPERYVEKYGRPVPFGEQIDRQAEAELEPAESLALMTQPHDVPAAALLTAQASAEVTLTQRDGTPTTNRKAGARAALVSMLDILDGWIEGQKSNHEACDHRGESRGEECWRTWAPSDIRNMINDAARELGLAEFPAPREPEEDKAL
jgi:hypothetical protein